ncbi:MAG: hypothetical protein ACRDWA_03810 [Acidimicrobiia bacterium]
MITALGGFDPVEISGQCGLGDIDRVPVRRAPGWLTQVWRGDVGAMTVPWAIFVRGDILGGDRVALAKLIQHELVHVRQWQEMGFGRFLARYLFDYLRLRRSGLAHQKAYENISLEREARDIASV